MNTLQKIILFVLIGTLLITCKKETLPPSSVENQPIFSFVGNMGGNALSLQAGVNNYYMYSSYKDSGVYSFTGTLKNTATNNNSIQIIINDDIIVAQGKSSDINKSVDTGNTYYYEIPGGNSISDSVAFTPLIYSGHPSSFTYTFGDGGSTRITTTKPVWHLYKSLRDYTTQLAVEFDCGLNTISNPINLVKQASSPPIVNSISSTIKYDTSPPVPDSVKFKAFVIGGTPPYSYLWLFNNSSTSSSTTPEYQYRDTGTFPCTLLVVDSKHIPSALYNYIATEDPDTTICRMDYSISAPIPIPNPYSLSNVTINYTDGNGNQYTSNNSLQPLTSSFQVVSVSNYQNNANNNKTKMLKVTFSCMLYNGNNSIPASGTAIIAVAYQ
jgi:hypothetical protein